MRDDDPTMVLEFLAGQAQVQKYLELGVQYGRTLSRIGLKVEKAIGVDITYEKLHEAYGALKGPAHSDLTVTCVRHFVFDSNGNIVLGGEVECQSITLYQGTTDDFFQQNEEKFDLIFIDAAHEYEQVKKDLHNSLQSLNENGFIALHDVDPLEKRLTAHDHCADSYKITKYIYDNLKDYQYTVYHYDKAGVGVLQKKLAQLHLT